VLDHKYEEVSPPRGWWMRRFMLMGEEVEVYRFVLDHFRVRVLEHKVTLFGKELSNVRTELTDTRTRLEKVERELNEQKRRLKLGSVAFEFEHKIIEYVGGVFAVDAWVCQETHKARYMSTLKTLHKSYVKYKGATEAARNIWLNIELQNRRVDEMMIAIEAEKYEKFIMRYTQCSIDKVLQTSERLNVLMKLLKSQRVLDGHPKLTSGDYDELIRNVKKDIDVLFVGMFTTVATKLRETNSS